VKNKLRLRDFSDEFLEYLRLRADDQYLPLPWPIRKDVFDTSDHVSLQLQIAGIVHLDFHCHTQKCTTVCLGHSANDGSGNGFHHVSADTTRPEDRSQAGENRAQP